MVSTSSNTPRLWQRLQPRPQLQWSRPWLRRQTWRSTAARRPDELYVDMQDQGVLDAASKDLYKPLWTLDLLATKPPNEKKQPEITHIFVSVGNGGTFCAIPTVTNRPNRKTGRLASGQLGSKDSCDGQPGKLWDPDEGLFNSRGS